MKTYMESMPELTQQEQIELGASFNPGWISAAVACFLLVRAVATDCRDHDKATGEY